MALQVSFRAKKYTVSLVEFQDHVSASVLDLKVSLLSQLEAGSSDSSLEAWHIKFLHQGKILLDTLPIASVFPPPHPTQAIKIIAMGMSSAELDSYHSKASAQEKSSQRLVKDDISSSGRQALARGILASEKASSSSSSSGASKKGGSLAPRPHFCKLEILPMLPDRPVALAMLEALAADPGIKACMSARGWSVGTLNEMYPEGKVGVSDVCVMGLNTNKGQIISLRLRTDDLRGFRHMNSVRKVLFHELAHNDVSDHNDDFFKLMRLVEKECEAMNWMNNGGATAAGGGGGGGGAGGLGSDASLRASLAPELASLRSSTFAGGSGRLGGASKGLAKVLPPAVMAANAARLRLTAEEREVADNCGCGRAGAGAGVTTQTARTTSLDLHRGYFKPGEEVEYQISGGGGDWVGATIVKIHLDDGPDKPYYTISYVKVMEEGVSVQTEKQTTNDRLRWRR